MTSRGVERAVRIRLDEQARYGLKFILSVSCFSYRCGSSYNEHIAQSELRLPIPLQRINADTAAILFHIGMPYARTKGSLGRTLRVVFRNLQAKLPKPLRIRCALWSGEQDNELCKVIWNRGGSRIRKEIVGWQLRLMKRCVICSEPFKGG